MRKLLVVLLAVALVGAVAAPTPALAGGRGGSHSGGGGSHASGGGSHHSGGGSHPGHGGFHSGHRGFHSGHGFRGFHSGFGVGVLFGPDYFYPYPAPYYVEPPLATCYTVPGYWIQVPYTDNTGYTTFYPQWVPDRTVCQ
jgi:hypothetical protein